MQSLSSSCIYKAGRGNGMVIWRFLCNQFVVLDRLCTIFLNAYPSNSDHTSPSCCSVCLSPWVVRNWEARPEMAHKPLFLVPRSTKQSANTRQRFGINATLNDISHRHHESVGIRLAARPMLTWVPDVPSPLPCRPHFSSSLRNRRWEMYERYLWQHCAVHA
jgi:hypothetical protein